MERPYLRGLLGGIPIGLGYLSVSFTVGIMASSAGLFPYQALLLSLFTLTSAGQVAGIRAIGAGAGYLSLLVAQLTINLRYSFMSLSLSQKTDDRFRGVFRFLLGFFITDEIFAVAAKEKEVGRLYFLGLATLPYVGWGLGTLAGALLGNVLPSSVLNCLCLAIYGMFVAIVAPVAAKDRRVLFAVLAAAAVRLLFAFLPYLSSVSEGISVSISAIAAALLAAFLFPTREEVAE